VGKRNLILLVILVYHLILTNVTPCAVHSRKIKSLSVPTQLHSIYCIELHVSAYFMPSLSSQFVFKTY